MKNVLGLEIFNRKIVTIIIIIVNWSFRTISKINYDIIGSLTTLLFKRGHNL